ncbi:condensation domain-containing protein [Rhodococcus sp. ARC_M6]|uniref:condensation domain-containing protein n=1 Tax=Rhodococcus sp. ARC_M6 TaxID=2928852 RepID=UPI001FB34FE6|nr:condensation domain-containing protein [Rhodococcus sp. ARC_M6]MCJ0903607.1 condensation domain-containing protein [Rhodococcus sp. ARC_M6]
MDLNLITHWCPQPGRVVEWGVTATSAERAVSAPIDRDLPPTTMQDRHVRRARAAAENGDPQSPWIGIAFDFEGNLDREAMTRSLAKYVRRHDTLHSWFSFDEATSDPTDVTFPVRRHVVPSESIDLTCREGPELSDPEDVRALVAQRFASETSALAWPAFVFGAVEHAATAGNAPSFTMFHAVDHAHTDLYSMVLMYSELRALYAADVAGVDAALPPAGSYAEVGRREFARASVLTMESPEVHQWLGYLMRSGGSFPGFALPLGADDAPKPAIGSRFDLADSAECEKFGEVCKANGSNFIGGIFTALAITEFELAGRSNYIALSPVNTRTENDESSQGWFINLIPVGIDIGEKRSFTALAETGQQAYHQGKTLLDVSVQQVIDVVLASMGDAGASSGLSKTLTPPPLVSYIDGRRTPDSDSYVATNATGIVGGKETQIASVWINRVHEGAWMAISHPDTPTAHESVTRFATHLSGVIKAVATQGDYSFSDTFGVV